MATRSARIGEIVYAERFVLEEHMLYATITVVEPRCDDLPGLELAIYLPTNPEKAQVELESTLHPDFIERGQNCLNSALLSTWGEPAGLPTEDDEDVTVRRKSMALYSDDLSRVLKSLKARLNQEKVTLDLVYEKRSQGRAESRQNLAKALATLQIEDFDG